MKKRILSENRFIIFTIVFASIIPNIGITFSTLGFTWTLYRVAVPVCMVLLFHSYRNEKLVYYKTELRIWMVLLICWTAYGTILIMISPFSDTHKGFIELLSLLCGTACLYVLGYSIREIRGVDFAFSIMRLICLTLVAWGIVEAFTGMHLGMSAFYDIKKYALPMQTGNATGIFYGVNDFSTFLTAFFPVLMYKKDNLYITLMGMIGIVYINYINDANICIFALVIGASFYVLCLRRFNERIQKVVRLVMFTIGVVAVFGLLYYLSSTTQGSGILGTISNQFSAATESRGSLWSRLTLYGESIEAALDTFLLGIGPAAFPNYFDLHPSKTGLVNPHNMYTEVLVEYGIIIAIMLVLLTLRLIIRLRKRILSCNDADLRRKLIAVCEMIIIYSVVCISPSSFIGYAWQWIIIVFGTIMVDMPNEYMIRVNDT